MNSIIISTCLLQTTLKLLSPFIMEKSLNSFNSTLAQSYLCLFFSFISFFYLIFIYKYNLINNLIIKTILFIVSCILFNIDLIKNNKLINYKIFLFIYLLNNMFMVDLWTFYQIFLQKINIKKKEEFLIKNRIAERFGNILQICIIKTTSYIKYDKLFIIRSLITIIISIIFILLIKPIILINNKINKTKTIITNSKPVHLYLYYKLLLIILFGINSFQIFFNYSNKSLYTFYQINEKRYADIKLFAVIFELLFSFLLLYIFNRFKIYDIMIVITVLIQFIISLWFLLSNKLYFIEIIFLEALFRASCTIQSVCFSPLIIILNINKEKDIIKFLEFLRGLISFVFSNIFIGLIAYFSINKSLEKLNRETIIILFRNIIYFQLFIFIICFFFLLNTRQFIRKIK